MFATIPAIASALSYPPYASIALTTFALIAMSFRLHRTAASLMVLAFSWTLLWSIPVASDRLRSVLEARTPMVVNESQLPVADAIVVLGGATRFDWLDRERADPWELSSSRLAAGARAWLTGHAPLVILSGGRGGPGGSEAARMRPAMERLGVPASAIMLEEESRNTEDNASNTAQLARKIGVRRILLVTSSLHMPRAMLLFERTGLEVTPVPVLERANRTTWRDRWIPSPSALWRSGRALKEYVALFALSVDEHASTKP